MPDIDLSKYYTVQEAAERLSLNSGKRISADYVRQLVAKGKISSIKINSRFSVYPKWEINEYKVEERGAKSGRAAKSRMTKKASSSEAA